MTEKTFTPYISQDFTCSRIDTVFHGDVMELLHKIPNESVELVLADPDYGVGISYNGKRYTQKFDDYTTWYITLATECMRILKPNGSVYLINYPKQNAYLRALYLDSVCAEVLDYSWIFNPNNGHSKNRLTTAHRSILHGRKSRTSVFYKHQVALPYQNPSDKRVQKQIANGSPGRMPYDWFKFSVVKGNSLEKTVHPCQIPQALSEMLILSCTKPNDTVFVPFGGSGAELEVCRKLNRHFISAEMDDDFYKMILERLEAGCILPHHRPQ